MTAPTITLLRAVAEARRLVAAGLPVPPATVAVILAEHDRLAEVEREAQFDREPLG